MGHFLHDATSPQQPTRNLQQAKCGVNDKDGIQRLSYLHYRDGSRRRVGKELSSGCVTLEASRPGD